MSAASVRGEEFRAVALSARRSGTVDDGAGTPDDIVGGDRQLHFAAQIFRARAGQQLALLAIAEVLVGRRYDTGVVAATPGLERRGTGGRIRHRRTELGEEGAGLLAVPACFDFVCRHAAHRRAAGSGEAKPCDQSLCGAFQQIHCHCSLEPHKGRRRRHAGHVQPISALL